MRKLEMRDWWTDLVQKKDTYSLRELADMFGVSAGAINSALKRNGITRKSAPSGPRTRRDRVAPVVVALAIAPKLGRGGVRGPRRATTEKLTEYLAELGKVSDAIIAEKAGLSIQTVVRYRRARGLDSSRANRVVQRAPVQVSAPVKKAGGVRKKRRSKIDPFADLLGTVADGKIASMAGVTVNAVQVYRSRRGISPMSRRGIAVAAPEKRVAAAPRRAPAVLVKATPVKVAVKVVPAPAERTRVSVARKAYRVTLADRSVIVVADGVVDAARQADAAGVVQGLELLGDVLR